MPELLPVRVRRLAGQARDPRDQLAPQRLQHPEGRVRNRAEGSVSPLRSNYSERKLNLI